jgi:glucose/arabinose dehydrogenase
MLKSSLIFVLAGACLCAAVVPTGFTDIQVASGLSVPTAMAFAPDGRLFVCEQTGSLRVIKNGSLLPTAFLTVTTDSSGERGLLGVAFDPDFGVTNSFVYIYYTVPSVPAHNRVSRFTANGDVAASGSEVVLLDLNPLSSATNHNGGATHFGPDKKLYVAVGENANGANSQSLGTLLGKMLRMNSDGSIPTDNPFYNTATGNNRLIWAWGLRNPFTFSFQPGTGRLFINDVGQSSWEEIDDGIAGANYGWPTTEGFFNQATYPQFTEPLHTYPHSGQTESGCAITGGSFYNPAVSQYPADYVGKYFYSDFCSGWIDRFDPATTAVTFFATGINGPVDLQVGPDGSLYYLAHNSGTVGKIVYAAAACTITLASNPAGRTVQLDGTPYAAPQTINVGCTSPHTISTTSPQAGASGTQYVFSAWNDSGAISHSVTAPASGNATYTATFTTQYFLTMNASFGGTVSPASEWVNSGQSVAISASAASGYTFSGWTGSGTGSYTGSATSTNITVNGPITENAGFTVIGSSGFQFYPVPPCRVMDTRSASGPLGGPFIAGGSTRTIPVLAALCGIPAGAAAYSLNVTAVPRTGSLAFLTVWPAGQAQPLASTLNSQDGITLANAAIVTAGTNGAVNAYATNDTDLVLDVSGYFAPPGAGSLQYFPLPPCRVLDTRNPDGTFGGPGISGGASRSFSIPSSGCGAAATAAAYALNITAVPQGPLGFLTAWPTGQALPPVSTLNSDGRVIANSAIVKAGTGGAVSIYASDSTHVVADINGYFAAPGSGGLNFFPLAACRVADTRNASGPLGGPMLAGGAARSFPIAGSCGLPSTAGAYTLNLTVVPPGPLGYLTAWPTGQPQPLVSTLNDPDGVPLANGAIIQSGTGGAISVFVTNPTHLVIDTSGYFQ